MKTSKHPEVIKARACTSDYLTSALNYARNTCGDIVDAYRAEEWFALYDAYLASGWDFTPDQWTRDQRNTAVWCGLAPEFDNETYAPLTPKCAGIAINENYSIVACECCSPMSTKKLERVIGKAQKVGYRQGWGIFESDEYGWQIQKDDSPDCPGVKKLETDDDALPLAIKALSKIIGALVTPCAEVT